jgi:hypothetical protein
VIAPAELALAGEWAGESEKGKRRKGEKEPPTSRLVVGLLCSSASLPLGIFSAGSSIPWCVYNNFLRFVTNVVFRTRFQNRLVVARAPRVENLPRPLPYSIGTAAPRNFAKSSS